MILLTSWTGRSTLRKRKSTNTEREGLKQIQVRVSILEKCFLFVYCIHYITTKWSFDGWVLYCICFIFVNCPWVLRKGVINKIHSYYFGSQLHHCRMLHFRVACVCLCLLFECHAWMSQRIKCKCFQSRMSRCLHLGLFAAVAVSEELWWGRCGPRGEARVGKWLSKDGLLRNTRKPKKPHRWTDTQIHSMQTWCGS